MSDTEQARRFVAYLRRSAESAARVQCLMAEAKTARQTDGGEYHSPAPQQTVEWEIADFIEQSLTSPPSEDAMREAHDID